MLQIENRTNGIVLATAYVFCDRRRTFCQVELMPNVGLFGRPTFMSSHLDHNGSSLLVGPQQYLQLHI